MLDIPGYRYDPTIRNYLPIVNNTPENRALNLLTADKIIEYDNINNLENQSRISEQNINDYQKKVFPQLQFNDFNTFNALRSQQIGLSNVINRSLYNVNKIRFTTPVNTSFYSDDIVNYYHKIYKCFPPGVDSQIVALSYSSSPFCEHHSVLRLTLNYSSSTNVTANADVIKHYDHMSGIKMSADDKRIILISKKEFFLIDKDSLEKVQLPFHRELPFESRYAFDGGEKLILGVNSKKGITSLDTFDLSSDGRRSVLQCHWDRKFVFRDLVYDSGGSGVYCLLRGRLNNGIECVLHHDLRCNMPTQKNLRRLSLNFHQNSAVQMTRVDKYSGLIVTHCQDGRCSLWDMRWMDRPAVEYANIAAGKPNMPISIDRGSQFVTMTDNDNVTRVFNLKTGLIVHSEKMSVGQGLCSDIYSFYEPYGLQARPTLLSNISPQTIQDRWKPTIIENPTMVSEHGINFKDVYLQLQRSDVYFIVGSNGKFVPRSINVDLDGSFLEHIKSRVKVSSVAKIPNHRSTTIPNA